MRGPFAFAISSGFGTKSIQRGGAKLKDRVIGAPLERIIGEVPAKYPTHSFDLYGTYLEGSR